MQQQIVIYISDLARALGGSEASIRTHIARRNWPRAIPKPLRIGARWAWRRQDVEAWLAGLAGDSQPEQKKSGPGRKKKEVQVLGR